MLACLSFGFAENICEGLVGETMVHEMETMSAKSECWFNENHHYMLTFKNKMMFFIEDHFEKILKAASAEVSEECKQLPPTLRPCREMTNKDDQSKCYIENAKTMSFQYRYQELCMKNQLAPKQSTALCRAITAILAGWHAVHTTC